MRVAAKAHRVDSGAVEVLNSQISIRQIQCDVMREHTEVKGSQIECQTDVYIDAFEMLNCCHGCTFGIPNVMCTVTFKRSLKVNMFYMVNEFHTNIYMSNTESAELI